MKPIIPVRFLLPIGLLLLSAGLIAGRYIHLSDFVSGSMIGAGIGITFLSVVYIAKDRKTA